MLSSDFIFSFHLFAFERNIIKPPIICNCSNDLLNKSLIVAVDGDYLDNN